MSFVDDRDSPLLQDVVDTIMGFGHTPVFITLEPERKLWILDRSTFLLEDMQNNVNAREFKKIYDVKYRYMIPLWQRIRNANQVGLDALKDQEE